MKAPSGGLVFDAVIADDSMTESFKRQTRNSADFTNKVVKDFDKIDAAAKKSAQTIAKTYAKKVDTGKILDFTPAERSMYGFNQKLERSSREIGVTFTRAGRDAIGFSNTFETSLSKAERAYQKFGGTAGDTSAGIATSFKQVAAAAIGFSALGALAALPQQLIQVRGEFQNIEVSLETILKSKAKADKLMGEVIQLAATTPFGLKDAAQATKQLLAYGFAGEEVIKQLKSLGNVAAGVGAPITDLAYLFGTLRAQGRAFTIDIRQFANRGIPIYEELAKVLGTTTDRIGEFVESGKVGFAEVQQAFANMSSEGGSFANLMEKQSKTLSGLSSQLGDAVDIMFNDMGRSQEGFLAAALTGSIGIVQNYQKIIDILKVSVATWGAYKAAVLLAAAASRANLILTQEMAIQQSLAAAAGTTLSVSQARAAAASVLLQRAQAGLNATMLANPYILAATALAGLISYFAVYHREVDAVDDAQKRVAQSAQLIGNQVGEEQAKVNALVAQIKGLNGNRDKQAEKIRELISLNPQLLGAINAENIATKEGIKAIEQYIQAKARQLEIQKLTDEAVEAQKRIGDLKQNGKELSIFEAMAAGVIASYAQGDDAAERSAKFVKGLTEDEIKDNQKLLDSIYGKIDAIAQVDAEIEKSAKTQKAASAKTVADYNKEIEDLKKLQETQSSNSKQFQEYQKQIEAAEKKRTAITGKLTKDAQDAAKEAEKRGPFGSVAYWEYVKNAAQELLDKTPTNKTDLVSARKKAVSDADLKLEEARKKVAVKTYEEELEEKKRLYGAFTDWVSMVGKDAAAKQFKDVIDTGKTYVDYLDSEIARLRDLANFTKLKDSDTSRLTALISERQQFTGEDTGIEVFRKSIDAAKASAGNLTETLVNLRKVQDTLSKPISSEDYEKRALIAKEIADIERERVNNLTTFLQSVNGSEEQRLEITKHYADMRAAVEKGFEQGRVKDREKALKQIAKAEEQELTEAKLRQVQQSKAFRDLNIDMALTGRNALQDRVDKEKSALNELKIAGLEYTDEYRQQVENVKKATKDLADYNTQKFGQIADAIGALGESVANLGGGSNGIAQMFGQLASGVSKVNTALKQNKDATAAGETNFQGYVQAAQGAVQLIGILIDSAKERKRAEEEFYKSVLTYESQYQLALTKRIGLQSIDNESIFSTDYTGRIKDGVAQYADAQQKYLDAIEKIAEEGRAKVTQKNKTDWGKVGQGAVTGAAAGAAFGPWGAAIGGVIGAAVGFFGGKKKSDVFGSITEQFGDLIKTGSDGFSVLNKEMAESLLNSGLLDEKTKVLVQTALDYADAMEQAKDQVKQTLSDLAGGLGDSLREALVGAFAAGEDSALAFRDTVGKVIEDMIEKLLFSQIFDQMFKDLQAEMLKSADVVGGGDGIFTDDIIRFMQASGPAVEAFNKALAEAQKAAQEQGLDIFNNLSKDNTVKSTTGAIATISQQSADELNGQFNAQRIIQAQMLVVMTNQLFELQYIRINTAELYNVVRRLDDQLFYLKNSDSLLTRIAG